MTVAVITHPACLRHDTGQYHPERADRLRVVLEALESEEFNTLLREAAPLATVEQLTRVHDPAYVERILALAPAPGTRLLLDGGDTVASAGTVEAALRSAGGAIMAVDAVMDGWARRVFVATRPPGHHAERAQAMGFCLFAHAAVAARHAQAKWGVGRVAIVDFDVHHGNGTQNAVSADPTLFYASTHQLGAFPGTGAPEETGVAGNVINVPLPPGSTGAQFRQVWQERVLPAVESFAPELLIVSAGFDAHAADPLAYLRLEEADFAWVTEKLVALAAKSCQGRLISVLEGGYDLAALAASVAAHVRVLLQIRHSSG